MSTTIASSVPDTAPTSAAPASMEVKSSSTESTPSDAQAKKKGGRGAPKKTKDASHDVKSGGGSSKKIRQMRDRTLTEKTFSKPALQKIFCPKEKLEPGTKENQTDKVKYVYLVPEHKNMRMSKRAIKPIQEFGLEMLDKIAGALVSNLAKEGRHNIGLPEARTAIRSVLHRSHVFGPVSA